MSVQFQFTRNPSVKVHTEVQVSGLVSADNNLVLIGTLAATGSSAPINVPVALNNFGDPVAALAECTTLFGANSQLTEMVIAAIKAVLYSDLPSKLFPPIICIPMVSSASATELTALLAANLSFPMPYVALGFSANTTGVMAAIKAHITAINANDRGDNGQFGSFAFVATDSDTSVATPLGLAAATEGIVMPWLRDLQAQKANKVHQVSAAIAAISAALGVPFNPANGVTVGGLVPPTVAADYLTPGDAGSVALGLSAGLTPLVVSNGSVKISRTITTKVTVTGIQDAAYYDMQDWQVLYYLRKQAYAVAQQPRYRQAKASIEKLQALKSELIKVAKTMEDLEMLQHVDLLTDQFTVARSQTNRHAAIYVVPVNVIPGFHNKGIDLIGGTQFDLVVA
ncbi:MAG: hypothetical protein EOP06_15185 [Proteobacteria bacterium]|nr:MAG: hypothetical protein EOP06_15185 [Pseudomonadota bacterium]